MFFTPEIFSSKLKHTSLKATLNKDIIQTFFKGPIIQWVLFYNLIACRWHCWGPISLQSLCWYIGNKKEEYVMFSLRQQIVWTSSKASTWLDLLGTRGLAINQTSRHHHKILLALLLNWIFDSHQQNICLSLSWLWYRSDLFVLPQKISILRPPMALHT